MSYSVNFQSGGIKPVVLDDKQTKVMQLIFPDDVDSTETVNILTDKQNASNLYEIHPIWAVRNALVSVWDVKSGGTYTGAMYYGENFISNNTSVM